MCNICHTCNQEIVKPCDITTGYGTNKKGEKFCYSCIGKQDSQYLESLPIGGKDTQYLVKRDDGYYITNWPASLEIKCQYVRKGGHNIAGSQYTAYFSYKGKNFIGKKFGENTDICHIKRIKE